jgi:2-dehydro-3-deoxyphosphogluconate aldolase / (4S)-4-hydroxy-2-oxoglutarate aldolase
MPTGGDLNAAAEFLKAGMYCLGIGRQLVERRTIADRNFDRIRELARQYAQLVAEYRRTVRTP